MTNAATFWDKAAAKYAKSAIKFPESYQYTLDRTRSYLGSHDDVLEIGAGTGSTALELAPLVGWITATDISAEMVRIGVAKAKELGVSNIDFQIAPADVPNSAGPYDVILAHNILHLVDDLPATLSRMHELLSPGGVFISKTFCKPTGFGPMIYYAARLMLPVMKAFGKAPNVIFLTIKELEDEITAHGFEIVESGNFPAKELRRYIVARRKG